MSRFAALEELFKGRHFDEEIVVLCVRWYLSFKLSYRDLVSMMNERGICLAHTTILRWVQHYTPEFEKRWKRYARPVGGSWRMDETYIKVRGEWVYLYRAVDKAGKTVDFYLSRRRDVSGAKVFLRKAMKEHRVPIKVTLDAYAASIKHRIGPMLGFKRFDNATVTISGIELAERIKKGQFKIGKLGGSRAAMTELWSAALAA
jgi:transposase-like protein